MKNLQFMFMRHGQTATNEAGRVTGRLDVPLNDKGRAQAEKAAETILGYPQDRIPKVIIHSGMIRAKETAEIIQRVLQAHGISVRIGQDEGLKDRNLGAWEGQLWDEAPPGETMTRKEMKLARKFPKDSETDAELQVRMDAAIARSLSPLPYGDGLRLFVWHGGIERLLIHAYGLGTAADKLPNAKVQFLYRDEDGRFFVAHS